MADLRVKMELPSTGTINTFQMPLRVEKFSGTKDSLSVPSRGQQFFQLSKSHNIAEAAYLFSDRVPLAKRGTKFPGFVSFSNSNKDKIFETASDVTISFTGSNITGFSIYFDNVAQQWATELTVNGVTYANNSSVFSWQGDVVNSVTVVIKKWNRANVAARTTSITVGIILEFDKERFTLVQRGMQSIEDNTILSWGILGQYGSINIIDIDNEIKDLATMGIIKSGVSIAFTITLDGNQIGQYVSNRWTYAFGDNIANVELISNMNILNNTIYNGYVPQEGMTNLDIFNELREVTERNGINVTLYDNSVIEYFNIIRQEYLELEQSTLLDAWTKFCEATSTRFYFNEHMEMVLIRYV